MSYPDKPDTAAELAYLAPLTGLARERAIGDFLLHRKAVVRQVAVGICQRNNLNLSVHVEDIISEVHAVAVAMFREMGDNPSKWDNFEGMLTNRARKQIAERLNGGEWTGISGDTAATKRRRLIHNSQKVLLETEGVLYEGQDLIDKHNERMLATRADAARQSVLATLDDLRPVQVHSVGQSMGEIGDTTRFSTPSVIDVDECPLLPSEAANLIKLMIEAAHARSERLGRAAEVFCGIGHHEPVTSRAELAKATGLSRDQAARAIEEIQKLAIEILARDFGIGGMNAA